jgi:hypothetical protein
MLATQLGQLLCVPERFRCRQRALDFFRTCERLGEAVAKAQLCFPYLVRNRSTRPAVSISFCFPVKNGWQTLQMSVWISACVERVWNVLPHAQRTVAVAYWGWISVFIGASKSTVRCSVTI